MLLVVLLIALVAVGSPSVIAHNPLTLIPVLMGIGFLAIIAATVFLWQMEQRKQAKLIALQLADIDHMTGVEFEQYIGIFLQSQGYHVRYTSTTGDYGIDLLVVKDHTSYAVQAKRYTGTVSDHAIMEAVAGAKHYRAQHAIVVTSNYFTSHAKTLAASTNCILVDRDHLAEWIVAFQSHQTGAFSLA